MIKKALGSCQRWGGLGEGCGLLTSGVCPRGRLDFISLLHLLLRRHALSDFSIRKENGSRQVRDFA